MRMRFSNARSMCSQIKILSSHAPIGCLHFQESPLKNSYQLHSWLVQRFRSSSTNVYCSGQRNPSSPFLYFLSCTLGGTCETRIKNAHLTRMSLRWKKGRKGRKEEGNPRRTVEKFRQIQLINYAREESTSSARIRVYRARGQILKTINIEHNVNGFVRSKLTAHIRALSLINPSVGNTGWMWDMQFNLFLHQCTLHIRS